MLFELASITSRAELSLPAKLLSSICRNSARLAKAKRVLPSMIETLVFFWLLIAIRAATLNYSSEIVQIWKNQLVAGY